MIRKILDIRILKRHRFLGEIWEGLVRCGGGDTYMNLVALFVIHITMYRPKISCQLR